MNQLWYEDKLFCNIFFMLQRKYNCDEFNHMLSILYGT